ncbi:MULTISPECIES: hypothetical protein [Aeromonas]|uniref:hypothetical protein n=1 Tax=Aeromonas TaxID=642 RepID=UPI001C239BA4|nr:MULTISPECIES: hypothetical protein [Aeromonas]QXC29313.1 hypothetical protein I6L39_15520 [Aeromonas sp. FDAARGOS 1409]
MPRDDISKFLVHWTKGETYEEAFDTLRSIVFEQKLLGGNGHIKGGHTCICFTEAPQDKFHAIAGKYKPFGVRVSKKWLFQQGGRPVIYQSEQEYYSLPAGHAWRHVRYEPDRVPPVDFSWEREWRIQSSELALPPEEVFLILPDEHWVRVLEMEHDHHEYGQIYMEVTAYGEWAQRPPEPFHYQYSIIHV